MFDSLYKRLQKIEGGINDLCEKDINPDLQEGLYTVISMIDDLKGYLNDLEDTILEENDWMDTTNI